MSEVSLEKLDRELRAAGIDFAALVRLTDGTLSLRDEVDQEIVDERVAGIANAHVPDPPRKRLAKRVRELFNAERPADNAPAATKIAALARIMARFVDELEADDPDLPPLILPPILPPEQVVVGRLPTEAELDAMEAELDERERLHEIEMVARAETDAAIGLMVRLRSRAAEIGISDEVLIDSLLTLASPLKEAHDV